MAATAQPDRAPLAHAEWQSDDAAAQAELGSPQFVQQLADRVLALMLRDLRIEFERTRDLRARRR